MNISALTLENFSNKSIFEQIKGVSDSINSGVSALSETINNNVKGFNDFVGKTKSSFVSWKDDVFNSEKTDKLKKFGNTTLQTALGGLTFLGGLATWIGGDVVTIMSLGSLVGLEVPAKLAGGIGMAYGANSLISGLSDYTNMIKGNWDQVGELNILKTISQKVFGKELGTDLYYLTDLVVTWSSVDSGVKMLKHPFMRGGKFVQDTKLTGNTWRMVGRKSEKAIMGELTRDSAVIATDLYSWAGDKRIKKPIDKSVVDNLKSLEEVRKELLFQDNETTDYNVSGGLLEKESEGNSARYNSKFIGSIPKKLQFKDNETIIYNGTESKSNSNKSITKMETEKVDPLQQFEMETEKVDLLQQFDFTYQSTLKRMVKELSANQLTQ